MSKHPVVHFEMPYKDARRVSKFYKDAFGWKMDNAGKDMGNYIVAVASETDSEGMNKTPGTINGGFYDITQSKYKNPSFVISVDDMDEAISEIEKAGGKIIQKPQPIPGVGNWAAFEDSEGNRVSILKPTRK